MSGADPGFGNGEGKISNELHIGLRAQRVTSAASYERNEYKSAGAGYGGGGGGL